MNLEGRVTRLEDRAGRCVVIQRYWDETDDAAIARANLNIRRDDLVIVITRFSRPRKVEV